MTAGYDPYAAAPGNQLPAPRSGPDDAPDAAAPSTSASGPPARPGPLPPKMEPPHLPPPTQSWPAPGSPVVPPQPGPPVFPPPAAAFPPPPAGPLPQSGPPLPAGPLPQSGVPLPAGAPHSGPPPGYPGVVPAARRRVSWSGVTALVLVLILAGITGLQAVQIDDLTDRLANANDRLAEGQATDASRLEGLEGRTGELEKQAGDVFNPEAISTVALPSVFRVRAGESGGTAFAVGRPAEGGGTNLFTNYHVVESVWVSGGRQVFIERRDQRFPATIVRVDEQADIAQLRTTGAFTGLVTATDPVKSGQQVVVVGAPLGLEDSVTTGVVSAFRTLPGGAGSMIQFDASINPGNSGGPVINGAKQVVGIATAKIADAEGVGLAIPINVACERFEIC